MKNKIAVLTLCGMLSTFCGSVDAQQAGKIFRIGFLDTGNAPGMAVLVDAFRQELSKLGWIEGKNIAIVFRFNENKGLQHLSELAADLVRLEVDLIVATAGPAASATKKVTTTIPVVMASAADPVGEGLIASLARPGGNVTGLSSLSTELNTKRLEILKDAIPKLTQIGFLMGPGQNIVRDLQLKELRTADRGIKDKI